MMTEDDLRAHVRDIVDQSCGSAGAIARKHGIHPKALTLFLSGARGPSAEVAAAFGYERRYMPLSATPASVTPDAGEMYRHKKRGTLYEMIGTAELQAEQPQCEHAELAIYLGEDGKLWARNTAEFHDGRFERFDLNAALTAASHAEKGEVL